VWAGGVAVAVAMGKSKSKKKSDRLVFRTFPSLSSFACANLLLPSSSSSFSSVLCLSGFVDDLAWHVGK
jgi:hypothetical protein